MAEGIRPHAAEDQEPARRAFAFGTFRLEPGVGLVRDGSRIHLAPKEQRLLECLVERAPRVVSHREIWSSVWPRQIVSYDSITRCVYQLRRACADPDGELIATIPRRGYRMVPPVHEVARARRTSIREKSACTTPEAYAAYLQGLREASVGSPERQARAVELFCRAHALDPDYAVALAAAAQVRSYQAVRGFLPAMEAMRLGRDLCDRALALDPELVPALAARAWFDGVVDVHADAALELLNHARALDPEHAWAHYARGWVLRGAGRLADATAAMRAAERLDPYSPQCTLGLAWTLFLVGSTEQALVIARRVARELDYLDVAHGYVAIFASWLGNDAEAIRASRHALTEFRDSPNALGAASYAFARAGERAEARRLVNRALRCKFPRPLWPYLAATYLELGDWERARTVAAEARAEHCPWYAGSRFDPRLAALGSDRARGTAIAAGCFGS